MDPELLSLLVTRAMPFGKYQGRLIADLPGPYLAWFARKGFPPGELGRLLALMHELDHNGLSSLLAPLRQSAGKPSKVAGQARRQNRSASPEAAPESRPEANQVTPGRETPGNNCRGLCSVARRRAGIRYCVACQAGPSAAGFGAPVHRREVAMTNTPHAAPAMRTDRPSEEGSSSWGAPAMKKLRVSAFLLAALCAAGVAQAQNAAPVTQEYQYPSARSKDGSLSPPSTLRMTVTPDPNAAPAIVRDTPESQAEYARCREVSDRAAVSNAQMQAGVAQCLKELEQRRQQQ